ncbi:unnamed protein product [marine sediment metagenome]|uniref:Uncharacterized protein n=1 Tax=marine sediment metagenome TaxID=412755 RepID=X1T6S9_9ZZZZ
MDVLGSQFKELYVTGFDFYQSAQRGECGHYDGFNTDKFERGVDYKKYYNTVYGPGNAAYRHNAANDIKALKRSFAQAKRLGKNVILGNDIKTVLDRY